MKRLFAFLALCLPIYLFAQGFGSFSHDQPYFAKDAFILLSGFPCGPSGQTDPASTTNLHSWWVFSDFATNTRVNYKGAIYPHPTNWWLDRVACSPSGDWYTNGGINAGVTNTALGMWFYNAGQVSMLVSTNTDSIGTNQTLCVILNSTNNYISSSSDYPLLIGPWNVGEQYTSSTRGGIWMGQGAGPKYWTWGTPDSGGIQLVNAYTQTNTPLDIWLVQSNTTAYFYTNGVLSISFSRTPPAGGYQWKYIGSAPDASITAGYKGYIYEILAWSTNLTLSQIQASRVVITNKYLITP